MRKVLILLLAMMASVCVAQVKVNVRLNMDGKYDKMSESQLKATRGEAWSENWENEVKPGILQDMIDAMNKREKGKTFVFGSFQEAEVDLLFSMVEMDADGETDAVMTCSFINEDGSLTMAFTEAHDKNGNSTKKFTQITSRSMVSIAMEATFSLAHKIKRADKKR